MKRLVVITVGKTHSGKTTFARNLEKELDHSIVMDQDIHAAFINTYYRKLQSQNGPNTLKHAISKLIVQYTIEQTNHHLIICNSNRSRKGRAYLLEELFPQRNFTRILVHFDIPDDILEDRIAVSQRSKDIFRGNYSSFMEVLQKQREDSLKEDIVNPTKNEAGFLYVIKDSKDTQTVIQEILYLAKSERE
ncbi:ATP-binding protein [Cytobacillus oceanisediminis]|uniref:ATP-binding protein n=1 Tax=Cytobacillus oceanisediminis TaxID=665099 RepID=UPI0011AA6F9D|nr:ATP-binding protein [Cytobacillus oceanisediminis]